MRVPKIQLRPYTHPTGKQTHPASGNTTGSDTRRPTPNAARLPAQPSAGPATAQLYNARQHPGPSEKQTLKRAEQEHRPRRKSLSLRTNSTSASLISAARLLQGRDPRTRSPRSANPGTAPWEHFRRRASRVLDRAIGEARDTSRQVKAGVGPALAIRFAAPKAGTTGSLTGAHSAASPGAETSVGGTPSFHFPFPRSRNPRKHGAYAAGLQVFKTGRAGQPPAWKVRFLRRVVVDTCSS